MRRHLLFAMRRGNPLQFHAATVRDEEKNGKVGWDGMGRDRRLNQLTRAKGTARLKVADLMCAAESCWRRLFGCTLGQYYDDISNGNGWPRPWGIIYHVYRKTSPRFHFLAP